MKSQLLSKPVEPKLLKRSAGAETCCIFRIPWSLAQFNNKAYEPKIVSIGPYHHGKTHLEMIQEHKHRFLEFFFEKTNTTLQELVNVVSGLEEAIRASYSENLDSHELINMMILDGCFILTIFLVVANKLEPPDSDDPVFKIPWILPAIRSDLLLLENQVPFFLLQTLFETSKTFFHTSLNEMAFEFFGYSIQKPKRFWMSHYRLDAKHLVDLIRKTFIPIPIPSYETPKHNCLSVSTCFSKEKSTTERSLFDSPFAGLVFSAKKLRLQGIKFGSNKKADTFLDIRLENGRLILPTLTLDDFISLVFLNCVAFEQLYASCSNHMTSYVAFMGCLMNDEVDAMFLGEEGIIENYFGTSNEVSQFFKGICKGVVFNPSESELANLFEGINRYTSKGYHVQWAGFKYTHFDSPWTFLSSSAALTLLVLTTIQTFFTAYGYFYPPREN